MFTTRIERTIDKQEKKFSQFTTNIQSITKLEADEYKNDSPLDKLSSEIDKLERAIKVFPYSELRSTKVVKSQGEFTHASATAVSQLLNMFSTTFFYSGKKNTADYFKQAKQEVGPNEKKIVLQLAEVLLNFKQKISEVEKIYFAQKMSGSDMDPEQLAQLRNDSTWVIYFHYIIETYLDNIIDPETKEIFSKQAYGNSIKNIQKLCEATYNWIAKNAPEELEKYHHFKQKISTNPLKKSLHNTTDHLLTTFAVESGIISKKPALSKRKLTFQPSSSKQRVLAPCNEWSQKNLLSENSSTIKKSRVSKRKLIFSTPEQPVKPTPFSLDVSAKLPQAAKLPKNSSSTPGKPPGSLTPL